MEDSARECDYICDGTVMIVLMMFMMTLSMCDYHEGGYGLGSNMCLHLTITFDYTIASIGNFLASNPPVSVGTFISLFRLSKSIVSWESIRKHWNMNYDWNEMIQSILLGPTHSYFSYSCSSISFYFCVCILIITISKCRERVREYYY